MMCVTQGIPYNLRMVNLGQRQLDGGIPYHLRMVNLGQRQLDVNSAEAANNQPNTHQADPRVQDVRHCDELPSAGGGSSSSAGIPNSNNTQCQEPEVEPEVELEPAASKRRRVQHPFCTYFP